MCALVCNESSSLVFHMFTTMLSFGGFEVYFATFCDWFFQGPRGVGDLSQCLYESSTQGAPASQEQPIYTAYVPAELDGNPQVFFSPQCSAAKWKHCTQWLEGGTTTWQNEKKFVFCRVDVTSIVKWGFIAAAFLVQYSLFLFRACKK